MLSWSSRIWRFEKATGIAVNFVGMLTKYTLTIGTTTYDIPDECLKNWDEIAFSLKRTDYSGVIRSFSTEFVFVGEIKDLLWDLYLENGFKSSASVAVYTITDRHTWVEQFSAPLDFSTIEIEDGALSINALDSNLAALIKAKKSQKYEYAMSSFGFDYTRVGITRMELKSYSRWEFAMPENTYYSAQYGAVCLSLRENKSAVISKAYLEPYDESNGDDGRAENSFFLMSHAYHASFSLKIYGYVRCYLDPDVYGETRTTSPHSSAMNIMTTTEADGGGNTRTVIANICNDDVTHITIEGTTYNQLYGGSLDIVEGSVSSLPDGVRVGQFAIIGTVNDPTISSYWENNQVYEWNGTAWILKGFAKSYYQDRLIDKTIDFENNVYIMDGTTIGVVITGNMNVVTGTDPFYFHVDWSDPIESDLHVRGLSPLVFATKLVQSICPTASVEIEADSEGLIAKTLLVPGEELRQIGTAKIYGTFQQFCDFMECVFGYTYSISGDTITFLHRSSVFPNTVVKEIDSFNEFNYAVNDNLIYSEVDIGFAKKEYGEIDGRYEKNFMNYYDTGFTLTDKKATLQSKYRADSYGIEFTARKSNSSSTDDKADEDIFIVHYTAEEGQPNIYEPDDNDVYNPKECLKRNRAFLAAMGNGDGVTFKMTASDGDNALYNIVAVAGSNLFTAGEIEFTTDDMDMPSNVNALIQIDHNGFRYKGFIQEAECRYGKRNGVKYNLIVKKITEI